MSLESTIFFLKKADGAVYGPVERNTLIDWAKQGRVAPEDSISKDRLTWYPAPTLTDLEMNWMVELNDGSQYGPVHLLALQELTADGSITDDARVANRVTKEVLTLNEALSESSAPRETQPVPTPTPAVQGAIAMEEPGERKTEEPSEKPRAEARELEDEPAGASEPAKREDWREMALRKDSSEREALKWKTLYEDERERNRKEQQAFNERMEGLRKSELAARMQLEMAERKLLAADENLKLFRQTISSDTAHPQAAQMLPLVESYNELSQRYDSLMQQMVAKSEEIQTLLESRKITEEHAEEQIKSMREIARRDREEADEARRKLAEIEQDHMELVKVYRELNDRFIRMRQESMANPSGHTDKNAALPLKHTRH